MKLSALKPREQRVAAIVLALLVLAAAYFVLLHWWFVAPLQQVDSQMADLRDTQSRYASAIAQKPQLQKQLASLGAGQAADQAFLAEEDPNAAAAGLMQHVVDVAAAHTQTGSCDVTQKTPLPPTAAGPGEPYRKASVNISLRCDIQALSAVLHDLEQGTPYLFVDNIGVYRNPVASAQNVQAPLEVQLTLSGYVRPMRPAVLPPPSAARGAR